jgi:hypothetical protein
MTQARKPKVALDATADGPLLRLYYTDGSAVLPRSLWTLPDDLVPHFHGWPVPQPTGANDPLSASPRGTCSAETGRGPTPRPVSRASWPPHR